MASPVVVVEIAFTTTPDATVPVWVDVTKWTRAIEGITINRGRQDEYSQVQPSNVTFTLINSDGRFTPGLTTSPYYPNVKKGRRMRVSVIHNGVTYRRFTGFVDEWPVTWTDASAKVSDVRISATSRMARLGRAREMISIIGDEILYDGPRAYYPFGEAVGSVRAGDSSLYTRPPMTARLYGNPGSGGIFFGEATGPGTDDQTAAKFVVFGGGNSNGFYLSSEHFDAPLVTSADTTIVMECFFLISAIAGFSQELMKLSGVSTAEMSEMYVSNTNKLTAGGWDPGTVNNYLVQSTNTLNANQTYHAMVTESISAGSLTAKLYLDGVLQDTFVASRSTYNDRMRLTAGGSFDTNWGLLDGVLAHVAVYAGSTLPSVTRIGIHSDAGKTGFVGEGSDARISRLARLAGVPLTDVSVETGMSTSMAKQLTGGKTAISLMQDVAITTEGGVLFDSRDGVLTFHARSHRYNATSVLTLDDTDYESTMEPKLDDTGLVNDITGSRTRGPITRAVDQASVTEHGVYNLTAELLTTDDNEVVDFLKWKLVRYANPQVRIPVVPIDLRRAGTVKTAAILAREIGDRITLTRLPRQSPAATMDFFIEGYTENITATNHKISFNLSPVDPLPVWQLDSSTYSVLDTSTRLGY